MDWYSDNIIYCDCPGFGQDNFLSSNQYCAVFWIQYDNDVDNTVMF